MPGNACLSSETFSTTIEMFLIPPQVKECVQAARSGVEYAKKKHARDLKEGDQVSSSVH